MEGVVNDEETFTKVKGNKKGEKSKMTKKQKKEVVIQKKEKKNNNNTNIKKKKKKKDEIVFKDLHPSYEFSFPVYFIRSYKSINSLLVCGGGGKAKFGVSNYSFLFDWDLKVFFFLLFFFLCFLCCVGK